MRSLKVLLLSALCGMAVFAGKGQNTDALNRFFCEALFGIGEDWTADELMPTVLRLGELHLQCTSPQ